MNYTPYVTILYFDSFVYYYLFTCIVDEVRPESKYAVARMKSSGRRVVMLTGDSLEVAKQVCQTVGVSSVDCHARLLPQGKLEWVQLAEGRGERVCMVGDGINDASALAGE